MGSCCRCFVFYGCLLSIILKVNTYMNAQECLDWNSVTHKIVSGTVYHLVLGVLKESDYLALNKKRCIPLNPAYSSKMYCLKEGRKNGKFPDPMPILFQCVQKHIVFDSRIVCRPPNDPMTWYRGEHSRTVRKNRCLNWDSPLLWKNNWTVYSIFDFDRFDLPGFDLPRTNLAGISIHENFCRNPDNSPAGPWCYTWPTYDNSFRQPCFFVCNNYHTSNFCLHNEYISHSFYPKKENNIARNYLGQVEQPKIFHRSNVSHDYYLYELLSTPKLAGIRDWEFANEPMQRYQPLTSDYFMRQSHWDRLSRMTCFQTGPMSNALGPWSYVKYLQMTRDFRDPTRKLKQDAMKDLYLRLSLTESINYTDTDRVMDLKQSLAYEQRHRGAGLWRPCFFDCEHISIKCLPAISKAKFRYFGPKTDTDTMISCLPYFEVYGRLIKDYSQLFHRNIIGKKTSDWPDVSFLFDLLTRDFSLTPSNSTQYTVISNEFARSHGFRMASASCINLGLMINVTNEQLDELHFDAGNVRDIFYRKQLRRLKNIGPGCFVKIGLLPTFEPCFRDCTSFEPYRVIWTNPCNMATYKPWCMFSFLDKIAIIDHFANDQPIENIFGTNDATRRCIPNTSFKTTSATSASTMSTKSIDNGSVEIPLTLDHLDHLDHHDSTANSESDTPIWVIFSAILFLLILIAVVLFFVIKNKMSVDSEKPDDNSAQ